MDDYRISIEDSPSAADINFLANELYEYNASRTGDEGEFITIFLRDKDGKILGGLRGWTAYTWLHVDILWVRLELRGSGYGKRLLLAAEAAAVERGCRHSELETFSFQALDFYLSLGYTIFGELDDVADGHKWYFLKKSLP